MKKYADDILFVIGALAILYGTYQISPIAAWFVFGVECLVAGVLIAWSTKPNDSN